MNLLKKLNDLNGVVGVESLHDSIIPSLTTLSRDKNWRIKLSVIEQFPVLARNLGQAFFNERLSGISNAWLADSTFTIREAGIKNYKELCEIFGP